MLRVKEGRGLLTGSPPLEPPGRDCLAELFSRRRSGTRTADALIPWVVGGVGNEATERFGSS